VTGWALVFGCHTAWRYLYDLVQGYFDEYYTSSIQINDDDGLFNDVKAWLAEQQTKKPSRKLKAVTDYEDNDKKHDNAPDEQGIYKYEVPMPRYEPSYGSDEFFHDGRRFKVTRSSMKDEGGQYLRESLEIFCYARSAQPVKDLLVHIRQWKIGQETAMTSVYRALNSGGRYWSRQSCRPSRPLHTVSLDQQQKDDIVEDINEYLHPATARWYAARGIPYRRGVRAWFPIRFLTQLILLVVLIPWASRYRQDVPLVCTGWYVRLGGVLRLIERQRPDRV
jgi:chaperone BCS1